MKAHSMTYNKKGAIRLWILLAVFIPSSCFCQVELTNILSKIKWTPTETELVNVLKQNIEPTQQNIWDDENTESNYRFKNVIIEGVPLAKSYIRVNRDTKKLFRLNFIALHEETNLSLYKKIENGLIKKLGEPNKEEDKLIWVFDKYKVEGIFIDYSNVMTKEVEEYAYAINVEPLQTVYVDWTKAIVESNNARSTIPQIEYFRIDNENNIYIKEKGKQELIKEKKRILPTPKGDVITFDGGMFCYRLLDNDIVFIKSGLAITYPIVTK